jgi:hypothetical protein
MATTEQNQAEVVWTGHKSKHSAKIGSGGYSARAHDAEMEVKQDRDGNWYFTVQVSRVGTAGSIEGAKDAALAMAKRFAKVY